MLSPSRGPERLIRIGQWLIALLFSYVLIQVGFSLIADLPLLAKAPRLERFVDRSRLEPVLSELKPLHQARDDLQGPADPPRLPPLQPPPSELLFLLPLLRFGRPHSGELTGFGGG